MEEGRSHQHIPPQPAPVPLPPSSNRNVFSPVPLPVTFAPRRGAIPMQTSVRDQSVRVNNSSPMLVHQGPVCPSSTMADLNLNEPSHLSLRLSFSTGHDQSSTRGFPVEMSSSFKNGDSVISVSWGEYLSERIKLKKQEGLLWFMIRNILIKKIEGFDQ